MKKRLVLMFTLVLIVLSACSAAPKPLPVIAVCLGNLNDPIMLEMKDTFIAEFGTEYDVQVVTAENNPATQAAQIDKFTAMPVKFMFVIPVDPSTLVNNLTAARKAGALVLVAGGDPGEFSRDAIFKVDPYLTGEYVTIMASEWIKKAHPDAEAGSIKTVILASNQNSESVKRSRGLTLIGEPYLVNDKWQYIDSQGYPISDKDGNYFSGKSAANRAVNPYYSGEVRIETTGEGTTSDECLKAMRVALIDYPDVGLILAHSSDCAEGASEAIMEAYADQPDMITSIKGIAVFGIGRSGSVEDAVIAASMSKGVFRGAVVYGGTDFPSEIITMVKLMLVGKAYPKVTWDELTLITALNGQLSVLPVTNTGFILSK